MEEHKKTCRNCSYMVKNKNVVVCSKYDRYTQLNDTCFKFVYSGEEKSKMKINKSWIMRRVEEVIGITLGLVIGVGGLMYVVDKTEGTQTKEPSAVVQAMENIGLKKKGYTEEQWEIVEDVHAMANVVISAVDGRRSELVDPSPENLDKVIAQIESHEDFLTEILPALKEWRKGNFIDTIKVHNHVWDMLNGNIGRAIAPSEEGIQEMLNLYDYSK